MQIKKIVQFLKKKLNGLGKVGKMYAASAGIFLLALTGLAVILLSSSDSSWNIDMATPSDDPRMVGLEEEVCALRRGVDGYCLEEGGEPFPQLVAVMVENHRAAHPLAGLRDAAVVYEAPVEGHYPRFMALFEEDADVAKVGPVRSSRPYFLDWLAEYPGALYMHVGGSPEALSRIAAEEVFDINEMGRGWFFWRSDARLAPHNTYTSKTHWHSALEEYGDGQGTVLEGWTFGEGEPCIEECMETVDITFVQGLYKARWRYAPQLEALVRSQFGRGDRDEQGEIFTADTVVIQFVQAEVVDAIGRLALETIGEGEAWVLRDGHVIKGRWQKDSLTSRTRFVDENGEDLVLKPGKIWVEVVSQFMDVEIAYAEKESE